MAAVHRHPGVTTADYCSGDAGSFNKQFRAVFTNPAGSATTTAATLLSSRRVRADIDGDGKADLRASGGPATARGTG